MATKSKAKAVVDEAGESAELDVLRNQSLSMGRRQDAVTAVTSLAELQQVFRSEAVAWQDIEPSFQVMDQESFEGVPFVIAGFRMNESTRYGEQDEVNPDVINPARFISMLVANYDPESGEFTSPWVIVNDGSTGIRNQLVRFARRVDGDADITKERFNSVAAQVPPIKCELGLRKSQYNKEIVVNGKTTVVEATTWYIA